MKLKFYMKVVNRLLIESILFHGGNFFFSVCTVITTRRYDEGEGFYSLCRNFQYNQKEVVKCIVHNFTKFFKKDFLWQLAKPIDTY